MSRLKISSDGCGRSVAASAGVSCYSLTVQSDSMLRLAASRHISVLAPPLFVLPTHRTGPSRLDLSASETTMQGASRFGVVADYASKTPLARSSSNLNAVRGAVDDGPKNCRSPH